MGNKMGTETYTDPYDTPEYHAFVEQMAKYCTCRVDSPCDSVLAGGVCDREKRGEDTMGDDCEECGYLICQCNLEL